MFLQTLVQLNILILATPALAGWTLMQTAQPGAARVSYIIWQGRTAEAVTPRAEQTEAVNTRQSAHPLPLVLPRLVKSDTPKPADQPPAFFVASAAALVAFNPFPHAARAP